MTRAAILKCRSVHASHLWWTSISHSYGFHAVFWKPRFSRGVLRIPKSNYKCDNESSFIWLTEAYYQSIHDSGEKCTKCTNRLLEKDGWYHCLITHPEKSPKICIHDAQRINVMPILQENCLNQMGQSINTARSSILGVFAYNNGESLQINT